MFEIIKKVFILLLSNIVNVSKNTQCVLSSNQKYMTQPTHINLDPNDCSQEFHNYPFAVKLDRCVGSCNTLNDLSNKVRVSNKTEDLNLSVFNMITGINESETLIKHVPCNSDQWWNNDKCQCECKKRRVCEKYMWNPATCSCGNKKYSAYI